MKSSFALPLIVLFVFSISCNSNNADGNIQQTSHYAITPLPASTINVTPTIAQIPLPTGYERTWLRDNSFSNWVRNLRLKKTNIVYLYNGKAKANQQDNYAVIDISTGTRDLQQCADALMRLRAEYLFSIKAFKEIKFLTVDGKELSFDKYAKGERYALVGQQLINHIAYVGKPCYDHKCLMEFLNIVFNYCSTYSLQLMCKSKKFSAGIIPGDMLVKAGAPGHALMVADVAINKQTGKKIYLLLQGFMPAQDIHIVRNPSNQSLSPWYEEDANAYIVTPGWIFRSANLKEW